MEYRPLGRTGIDVSVLGYGCGDVGGLIVRGTPAERTRAVARAVELGVNYFDTATSYGNGVSEQHLGEVLRELRPNVFVGTKVRLRPEDLGDVGGAVVRSLEGSLGRLGRSSVDLLQVHNSIAETAAGSTISVRHIVDEAIPMLQRLKEQGKIRFFGITANGEPDAILRVIDAGTIYTTQVFYNLLNPTAGGRAEGSFPGTDFKGLLPRAKQKGIGAIGVRALAAGALSGVSGRHPIAAPQVAPIGSGPTYEADVRAAGALKNLIKDGFVESLPEAAYRFIISHDAISTVLVGASTIDHLEQAAAAVTRGPLPPAALARVAELWKETRGQSGR
ncbi:MAG TPA: aldo/keto reductase [Methylomirabilota bacterium]|nr:aldo/keto reductase [Methylomirabilota bacterium]